MKNRSHIYDINRPRTRHGKVSQYDDTYMYKGTLMQFRKSLYMFMFMLKYYPENFTF